MSKLAKGVKEFLGLDSSSYEEDIEKSISGDIEQELESKKGGFFSKKKSEKNRGNSGFDMKMFSGKEDKDEPVSEENCQTILLDPKSFSECKKIADYIRHDKMVTLNLEYLETETAERMLDFLMGAMLVKQAAFVEISKKVYTSVPKSMRVFYEGKKVANEKLFSGVGED
ncbi:MAG: cell division protein SepF [Fusobacteriaceae bacterium]